jgi:hypothetical protein
MDWIILILGSQVVMDNWSLRSAIHYCSRPLSNYMKAPITYYPSAIVQTNIGICPDFSCSVFLSGPLALH